MKTKFDVVIIGSGAGGAPIAHVLAKAGRSVLVFDKGPLLRTSDDSPGRRSDFRRDELIADGAEKILNVQDVANIGQSYYSSHVEPDLNDEPHVYRGGDGQDYATIEGYTAQVVGGGTQLYGGVSLRFTPTDLRLRSFNEGRSDLRHDPNDDVRREARDWPIDYDRLEPYYCRAERLVGLNGTRVNQMKPFSEDNYQPPLTPNPISQFAKEGMEELGRRLGSNAKPYRTPLAVITRDHDPSGRKAPLDPESAKCSYVNRYGDPLGLKSNTWVSLLRPIRELPNFELRPNCVVTHLVSDGSRVRRVCYLDPGGKERFVEADLVVVACSAIESVRLLKLSATLSPEFDRRINQNPLLGRYFLTHCFGGARALMPGRYDKSKALDADWATDCCAADDFIRSEGLWAGGAIYNNTSDQALPLSLFRTHGSQDLDTLWKGFTCDTSLCGQGLVDFLDREFGRGLSVSFMANQVPQFDNRIELHPKIVDKLGRPVAYIVKTWHSHDVYLMQVLAEQCGNVLRYGGDPIGRDYPLQGAGGIFMAENARARMANHILGGARFGSDPRDSVLDPNCRAWEFDNLYVTDGAFMPTSGSCNPTLTIQANSFRVADHLLERT
ncbi:MAG: GMC family oxidoreductase [Planctomycetota bacterium]